MPQAALAPNVAADTEIHLRTVVSFLMEIGDVVRMGSNEAVEKLIEGRYLGRFGGRLTLPSTEIGQHSAF